MFSVEQKLLSKDRIISVLAILLLSMHCRFVSMLVGSKWTASSEGLENCNKDASWRCSCRCVIQNFPFFTFSFSRLLFICCFLSLKNQFSSSASYEYILVKPQPDAGS